MVFIPVRVSEIRFLTSTGIALPVFPLLIFLFHSKECGPVFIPVFRTLKACRLSEVHQFFNLVRVCKELFRPDIGASPPSVELTKFIPIILNTRMYSFSQNSHSVFGTSSKISNTGRLSAEAKDLIQLVRWLIVRSLKWSLNLFRGSSAFPTYRIFPVSGSFRV